MVLDLLPGSNVSQYIAYLIKRAIILHVLEYGILHALSPKRPKSTGWDFWRANGLFCPQDCRNRSTDRKSEEPPSDFYHLQILNDIRFVINGKPQSAFTVSLGATSCSFRREIKPYESYDTWICIISRDEKWVYLVTHFAKQSSGIRRKSDWLYPQQDSPLSSAISRKAADSRADSVAVYVLSKVEFKDGRRTISPKLMFELAGLYPRCEFTEKVGIKCIQHHDQDAGISSDDSGHGSTSKPNTHCDTLDVFLSTIEKERCEGLKTADLLDEQTILSEEFRSEKYYDSMGMEDVISTLAQLSKISKYQLI